MAHSVSQIVSPDSTILAHRQVQEIVKKYDNPAAEIVQHIREEGIHFFSTIHRQDHCEKAFHALANADYQSMIIKKDWAKNVYTQESRRGIVLKKSKFDLAASNLFFEQERLRTSLHDSPSPESAFYNNEYLEKAIRHLLDKLPVNQPITSRAIRNALFAYYPPMEQFNPLAARYLIDQYGSSGSILDVYSGWGDRLAGFIASTGAMYTGICDNSNLLDCYVNEIDFLSQMGGDDQDIHMSFDNAEDLDYGTAQHELVLTSIPRYSLHKGDLPSTRYGSLSQWKKKFLRSTLESAWESLKTGGYMCIHLDDYRKNKSRVNIVNYLLGSIGVDLKATRLPPIGYQFARNNKNVIEPIWIFRKKPILSSQLEEKPNYVKI